MTHIIYKKKYKYKINHIKRFYKYEHIYETRILIISIRFYDNIHTSITPHFMLMRLTRSLL